ncbi:cadherin-like beta sandwich domain-containing protein [Clostridium uliginosum]|uniref:Putative cell wall binding repeat-containing protein n=1 Tax=Clostridium uliginosum TaxID=119641 RepID=A0A1I1MPX0_9CLOT|nr:cadherin-like beta sandwich domain-containing protein [Clostridium uliginosum]SFC85228.1 Putative cell wall binding repeat-containing protein [Clostridium uliginosum]
MGKKNNKKRIISLLITFMCIFSLLPTSWGGYSEKANASTPSGAGYEITVGGVKLDTNTQDPSNTVGQDSNDKSIYITKGRFKSFEISIPDNPKDTIENKESTLGNITTKIETTTKIERKLELTTINKMSLDDTQKLGCTVTDNVGLTKNGLEIHDLPLGINEIGYKIKETTTITNKKTTYTTDDKGNISNSTEVTEGPTSASQYTKEEAITIEHASVYAQDKIDKIDFSSYIGKKDANIENTEKNKVPFLYKKQLETTETETFFTYEHIVNDQISTLDYVINFQESFNLDSARVWMDGIEDLTVQKNGNKLIGSLSKTDSKIMVISIPNDNNLGKNYAIKLKFKDENSTDDYTLRGVKIDSKYYSDIITDNENYIGKSFEDLGKKGGTKVYKGQITLDKRAGKVKITPTFGAKSGYVIKASNHYINDYGGTTIKQQDFDQYVSFSDSTSTKENANVIYLDVYKGSSDSDVLGDPLATYQLEVKFSGEESNFNFAFDNAILKEANGGTTPIPFNSSTYKYDFYLTDPTKPANIKFTTIGNFLDGAIAKVTVNGQEEVVNKDGNLSLDLSKCAGKQMIIRPYKNGNPVGDKYIFNIQGDGKDPENPEVPSKENAYLSSLSFSTGDLKKDDGTAGFSKETLNYDLTVKKDNKKIDVTAVTDELKANITEAKVVETGKTYALTSGSKMEIPLQETGETTLQIIVTAENGKTKKLYTVTIKQDARSSNAKLKNVELNPGDFNFDPDNDTCKVRVDPDVKSIKVKPIPEDENYSNITVDGEKFTSSPISVSLKGQWKTEIEIKITSEDGTKTETYTLNIYRTNDDINDIKDPNDDNNNEDNNKNDAYYDESNKIWIDLSKYEEWAKVKGNYIYFDNKGRQVKDAWVKVEKIWYYVNSSGYRATGWKQETDGRWYCLDNNGKMQIGWYYDKNRGNQYYFNANGIMKTGWLLSGGSWYYFDGSGRMLQNERAYIDGQWYSFSSYGMMY